MGAVMGGMYALGYSTDEIIDIISSANWDRLISNEVDRRKTSFRHKTEDASLIFTLPFSFKMRKEDLQSTSFKNSLPQGFVSGDNIINMFNALSVGYADSLSFGQLPIPFVCVATDMLSGEAASAQADKFAELKRKVFERPLADSVKAVKTKKAINIIKNKVLISKIEFVGVNKEIEKWMHRACKVHVGDSINKKEIDESVSIFYGTGSYKSVTYTLHDDLTAIGGYILRFNLVEKSPHDFGLGLRFDSQDMLSVLLHVGINAII